MEIQYVLIAALFLASLTYLGRMFYNSFYSKKSCGGNCGCSIADLDEIEKEMIEKKVKKA
jgi:hypothetical protein